LEKFDVFGPNTIESPESKMLTPERQADIHAAASARVDEFAVRRT